MTVAGTDNDPYRERLIAARDSSAVIKLRFASLKSRVGDTLIFAFEGDDDKVVYAKWIGRIAPLMRYEPFVCEGKRELRKLKNSLSADLGGMESEVYYFVDRDFDDLSGFANTTSVFMTDRYSVENYLVEGDVVELSLRDEFPCHEKPHVRSAIVDLFNEVKSQFLQVTGPVNRRLYIARRLGIEIERLPDRISALASVELTSITAATVAPEEVVLFSRDPSPEEVDAIEADFLELSPDLRYRGKFLYLFFKRWMQELTSEFGRRAHGLFDEIPETSNVRHQELVLGNYAHKSPIPQGLAVFLQDIHWR